MVTHAVDRLFWRSRQQWFGRLPERAKDWLYDEGSLTRRLQACCVRGFRVRVLYQGWVRSESRPGSRVWIREVLLQDGDDPWVFAQTRVPETTLTGSRRRLLNLGNRPLGEFLFTDSRVVRGPIQAVRIVPGQPLYRRALLGQAPNHQPAVLGRRSVFYFSGKPLSVCEIFLPGSPLFDTH